ncbi:putative TAR DNA-binding protein 43 isoform X2 [Apostichopus japonicus]|uniref:Putative TAR DNA-binding protein 43 isoform X2 n=1 Tax=Stichopus japonicus TaxID=307972 RepID=A0A2G8LDM0_STIJA|nr:putative TAR DNA-binding protein 43 isoform X2 [Apostichopus japonicus]
MIEVKMEFIRVAEDQNDQEPIELPVEDDGTILLSTVTGQFPGACGLKYRTDRGSWRGVRLADERLHFTGAAWIDTVYCVVYPKGTTGSENKRKGEESSGNPAGKTRRLDVKKNQDLVVLGLPWKTTEEELKTYFEQYGEVVFSEIKFDRLTGKSKGFGFVRFAEAETGKQVMVKKHIIQGRTCEVKVPDSRPERRKLFVRCLSKDISDADLKEYFSDYGDVTEVYLPSPHRGFAFVTFEDGDIAQELKGRDHIIKGHHVQLNDAEPKGKNRNQWEGGAEGFTGSGPGSSGDRAPFSGRGDREYRDFRGRDFHDDRERGGRPQGRFGRDNRENMGNMGNQLPMALAAALNQAGWGMLLQGMQGQGGPGGHGNQAGPNNGATGGTSGNQPPAMGGNTDGLGGGYGSPHGMAWSQGNQAGGGAGDNAWSTTKPKGVGR